MWPLATVILLASGATSLAQSTPSSCDVSSAPLCPACDNANITAITSSNNAAHWVVSCDYMIRSSQQKTVEGDTNPAICLEACDETEGCYGTNLAPNGSCTVLTGTQLGLVESVGYVNLLRLSSSAVAISSTSSAAAGSSSTSSTSSSTSHVSITETIFASGAAPTASSNVSAVGISFTIGSTSTDAFTAAAIPSATPSATAGQCDLELEDLCPVCDGQQVQNANGTSYMIVCDSALHSNNGTYSVQQALTPEECLEQCDDLTQAGIVCHGASYYDYRDCELAKGNATVTSESGYTAFVPVATGVTTTTSSPATSSSPLDPVFSILPIDSGCNASAPTCPECGGYPVKDKVNASYTMFCVEAICGEEPSLSPQSMESCMESCDQDAECLAVKWFPESNACHLCDESFKNKTTSHEPYIVLVDNIFDSEVTGTVSANVRAPSTAFAGSITASPTPFVTTTDIASSSSSPEQTALTVTNPGGPITNLTTSTTDVPLTSINPGGPILNLTSSAGPFLPLSGSTSTSALPASSTSFPSLTCPVIEGEPYVDPTDLNLYQIGCDSVLDAAHSRFVSAADFAACIASCTDECGGVQFGYATRCGLYTEISDVSLATGWTVATSITAATAAAAAASTLQSLPTPTSL